VCRFGARSFIAEDIARNIGKDIMGWMTTDDGPTAIVDFVTFSGIPADVSVSYTDTDGSVVSEVIPSNTYNITISGDESSVRASLDTFTLQAPLNSDVDFTFVYSVGTVSGHVHKFTHPVTVFAIADPPTISATKNIEVRTKKLFHLEHKMEKGTTITSHFFF
jgi:hypothetical protein